MVTSLLCAGHEQRHPRLEDVSRIRAPQTSTNTQALAPIARWEAPWQRVCPNVVLAAVIRLFVLSTSTEGLSSLPGKAIAPHASSPLSWESGHDVSVVASLGKSCFEETWAAAGSFSLSPLSLSPH